MALKCSARSFEPYHVVNLAQYMPSPLVHAPISTTMPPVIERSDIAPVAGDRQLQF